MKRKAPIKRKKTVANKTSLLFTAMMLAGVIVIIWLKMWLVGSIATSTIKSISGHCGNSYGIEAVFSGDFFCPEVQ